jgi:hypothetical protein
MHPVQLIGNEVPTAHSMVRPAILELGKIPHVKTDTEYKYPVRGGAGASMSGCNSRARKAERRRQDASAGRLRGDVGVDK